AVIIILNFFFLFLPEHSSVSYPLSLHDALPISMFIAELNHPNFENYDLTHLRTGIMAGSSCPIEVMQDVMNKMGASEITIAYGLTETSPVFFQTKVDDPIELKVSTVGQV